MYCVIDLLSDEAVFFGNEKRCAAYVEMWNNHSKIERYVVFKKIDIAC